MAKARRKQKVVQLKINIGKRCTTCGKRYINPFKHVCKIKFGVVGKKRLDKRRDNK